MDDLQMAVRIHVQYGVCTFVTQICKDCYLFKEGLRLA